MKRSYGTWKMAAREKTARPAIALFLTLMLVLQLTPAAFAAGGRPGTPQANDLFGWLKDVTVSSAGGITSGGLAPDHLTATPGANTWEGYLGFYVAPQLNAGAATFQLEIVKAPQFSGELTLLTNSALEVSAAAIDRIVLRNKVQMTASTTLSGILKVKVDDIRALTMGADGRISLGGIELRYRSNGAAIATLGALSLTLNTVKDTYRVTKTAVSLDPDGEIPGLSNPADRDSHYFVKWNIDTARQLTQTRPVTSGHALRDNVPLGPGSAGSIVSIGNGTALLYEETGGITAPAVARLAGTNTGAGLVVINTPAAAETWSIVAKYPKSRISEGAVLNNEVLLQGTYRGANAPERLGGADASAIMQSRTGAAVRVGMKFIDENGVGQAGGVAELGRPWQYALDFEVFREGVKDVALYTVLPHRGDRFYQDAAGTARGSQFDVELLGLDLSRLPQNVSEALTVYGSTSTNPGITLPTAGSTETTSWTALAASADLSQIRALAFRFDARPDGFIFSNSGVTGAGIGLQVRAPSDLSLVGQTAMANTWMIWNMTDLSGSALQPGRPLQSPVVETMLKQSGFAITGIVFRDSNRNGRQDNQEAGLANYKVEVFESTRGAVGAGTSAGVVSTDAFGRYLISVDKPGDYRTEFTRMNNNEYFVAEPSVTGSVISHIDRNAITQSQARSTAVEVTGAAAGTGQAMKGQAVRNAAVAQRSSSGSGGSKPSLNKDDHFAFMQGYPEKDFRPGGEITRAEVCMMFSRLLTEKMDVTRTCSTNFSDVAGSSWYANAVGYMIRYDLIEGYPDGAFRPNAPVTRAEFATIATRFEGQALKTGVSFSDVSKEFWADENISEAERRRWVQGYPDGTFRPDRTMTRAEVVTVVNRMLERKADAGYLKNHADGIKQYTDVKTSHWAYEDIMEASNDHDFEKRSEKETWMKTGSKK